jgi:serine/threonine-protein kinase
LRIEAAAFHGRPVALRIIEPWTRPTRMTVELQSGWQRLTEFAIAGILVSILGGGAFVARRNLRLGRGDRKGATRLAAFVLVAALLAWLFQGHHIPGTREFGNFLRMLGFSLLFASITWTFYLALEPFLRRLWPEMIVSWVRLLDGRFRDPLVGRDVLVGLLAAAVYVLALRSMVIAPAWVGLTPHRPDQTGPPIELEMGTLVGLHGSLGNLSAVPAASLIISMGLMTLLLLCRLVLRSRWLAMVVFIILNSVPGNFSSASPVFDVFFNAAAAALCLALLFRFGLLTFVVFFIANDLLFVFPLTFDSTAWYAFDTLVVLACLVGLAIYAFRTSLAGQPAFAGALDPEARSA